MAKLNTSNYQTPKKKSHAHNKNASKGQVGYKKPYRGQGR